MDRDAESPLVPVQPDREAGGVEEQISAQFDEWLASGDTTVGAPTLSTPSTPSSSSTGPVVPAPPAAGPAARFDAVAPNPPATLLVAVSAIDDRLAIPAGRGAVSEAPRDRRHGQRFVLFTVAGTTYGVLETFVTELGRVPNITSVPNVPPWVRGVTNLRGDVLSVIDVRVFLGLDSILTHKGRMLVVRLLNEEFSVGLLVDSVDQIVSAPADDIRAPASPLEGALASYLSGVCQVAERLVAVLDLDRLLRSPEIRQFDDRTDVAASA